MNVLRNEIRSMSSTKRFDLTYSSYILYSYIFQILKSPHKITLGGDFFLMEVPDFCTVNKSIIK
jgi:hypothetical protein